jgi:hypothetical protein
VKSLSNASKDRWQAMFKNVQVNEFDGAIAVDDVRFFSSPKPLVRMVEKFDRRNSREPVGSFFCAGKYHRNLRCKEGECLVRNG